MARIFKIVYTYCQMDQKLSLYPIEYKETYSYDHATHALENSLTNIHYPQTLEELLMVSTLCQKVTSNTPRIGIKKDGVCDVQTLDALGMKHLTTYTAIHSEFLSAILATSSELQQVIEVTKAMVLTDHDMAPDRFIVPNTWETYVGYCEGRVSLEEVKAVIAAVNPLVDISHIGAKTPFRKIYDKFKAFIEAKMVEVGLSELWHAI